MPLKQTRRIATNNRALAKGGFDPRHGNGVALTFAQANDEYPRWKRFPGDGEPGERAKPQLHVPPPTHARFLPAARAREVDATGCSQAVKLAVGPAMDTLTCRLAQFREPASAPTIL